MKPTNKLRLILAIISLFTAVFVIINKGVIIQYQGKNIFISNSAETEKQSSDISE